YLSDPDSAVIFVLLERFFNPEYTTAERGNNSFVGIHSLYLYGMGGFRSCALTKCCKRQSNTCAFTVGSAAFDSLYERVLFCRYLLSSLRNSRRLPILQIQTIPALRDEPFYLDNVLRSSLPEAAHLKGLMSVSLLSV
ncbi:hypothetical protein OSTOST_06372, partial [Ostertagia ostertagi]